MSKPFVAISFAILAIFAIPAQSANETTRIASSNGARQCESGRVSPSAMKRELLAGGVNVVSMACGSDGLMHPAVCGADAGEINIFEISSGDMDKAESLGFKPLSDWPDTRGISCRDGDLSANQAVEISIFGIGPPVDPKAYKKLRLLIGNAIAGGVLDKFIVRGYGIEGGFSACVEAGRFAPENRFANFVKQLKSIRANPKTTAYSVAPVESCML